MNVWPYSQGMILDHDTLQGLRTNNPEASCLMFYAVCAILEQAQEMTCASMICMLCHSGQPSRKVKP